MTRRWVKDDIIFTLTWIKSALQTATGPGHMAESLSACHGTSQTRTLSVQEGNHSIHCAITSCLTSSYYKRIKGVWPRSKHWAFIYVSCPVSYCYRLTAARIPTDTSPCAPEDVINITAIKDKWCLESFTYVHQSLKTHAFEYNPLTYWELHKSLV